MHNRTAKVLVLSLAVLLLAGSNAFAEFELENYATMWMTNAQGNTPTESQTTFGPNEHPWLYIRFLGDTAATDKIGLSTTNTEWTWAGGEVADKSFLKTYESNENDIWIGFSEEYWKKNMQIAGDWAITAFSIVNNKVGSEGESEVRGFSDTVNFKVNAVPEPISALLFLTGGAAIAAFRRRKA